MQLPRDPWHGRPGQFLTLRGTKQRFSRTTKLCRICDRDWFVSLMLLVSGQPTHTTLLPVPCWPNYLVVYRHTNGSLHFRKHCRRFGSELRARSISGRQSREDRMV